MKSYLCNNQDIISKLVALAYILEIFKTSGCNSKYEVSQIVIYPF